MDLFGGSLARVAPERVVDVEAMTQLGFDGRPEAIGAAGMLPLQVQAHAVEFFLGDALHDPCAIGLKAKIQSLHYLAKALDPGLRRDDGLFR